jgi:Fe-S cluster assembly ATP-binding protein
VGLLKAYVSRNVNEGFSGGEKKRLELLQLLLLEPKLAILDEMDSGMDSDGVKRLIKIVNDMKNRGTSFILITHNKKLLDEVTIDQTWEMQHGQLQTGV